MRVPSATGSGRCHSNARPPPPHLLQRLSLATGALSSVLSVVDLLAAHGDAPLPPALSAATAAYVRALDLQVGAGGEVRLLDLQVGCGREGSCAQLPGGRGRGGRWYIDL